MSLRFAIRRLLLDVVLLLGCVPVQSAPHGRERALPPGLTNALARDIALDLPESGLRQVHVLATKLEEDDRPLRVERALVLTELNRGRWEFWYLSRNPKGGRERSAWTPHYVTDSTQRGWKSLDHRPTAEDVEGFLKLSGWTFSAEPPFRLLRGEIFQEAWKSALGFQCPYRFPKR